MVILQNIIFPVRAGDDEDLFVRRSGDGGGQECHDRDFGTYFNLFPYRKWKTYTRCGAVGFCVEAGGRFEISLYAVSPGGKERLLEKRLFDGDAGPARMAVPEGGYLFLFACLDGPDGKIRRAFWYTDVPADKVREVYLSIAICTFRRESYIRHTLDVLADLFAGNPSLGARVRVHIADNGQTLDRGLERENVFIHPNVNSGGSGGFARCMMEILARDTRCTHVLIMDDDIDFLGESIFRSFQLLSLVKEEYAGHFLGGAMFSNRQRWLQFACDEMVGGVNFCRRVPASADQREFANLVRDAQIHEFPNRYQAWWYCIVPIRYVGHSLPYPMFFQMDDIEYGLRHRAGVIHMNGICVWHEPFFAKQTNAKLYFSIRNMLIASALLGRFEGFVALSVGYRLLVNALLMNYLAIHPVISAFDDFFAGPGHLPVPAAYPGLFRDLSAFNEEEVDLPGGSGSIVPVRPASRAVMVLAAITLNGVLLPDVLLRGPVLVSPDLRANIGNVVFRKEFLIDRGDGRFVRRILDRKRFFLSIFLVVKMAARYLLLRRTARKAWRDRLPEMTSVKWWKRYLGLKEKENT